METKGNLWGVSDNHSRCNSGDWARLATENGLYSVCISTSDSPLYNEEITLASGEKAMVSIKRHANTLEVAQGDTFFLADKKRGQVFLGFVKSLSSPLPFRSTDPTIPSMRRSCDGKGDFRPIADEIEVMWNVEWSSLCPLTEEWKEYVHYSDQSKTIRPISKSSVAPKEIKVQKPAHKFFFKPKN
jgi:hypothetical protein